MDTDFKIRTMKTDDGAEIQYIDEGEGQPLLYIYGIGSSIETQKFFIAAMQEHCRMIVFDQRAFGLTAAAGEMGIHQSARDAGRLIELLGIKDVILFGYSMGAAVVFSYLEQFGSKLIKKILIGDMSPKLINDENWKLGLYQGWYTQEMYERDLKLIETDYERFALILAEQLLIKRQPEEKRDFSGSAKEIRERILQKRGEDPVTYVLLKGLVDLPQDHRQANFCYWKTMIHADFRPLLGKINVPAGILYAIPGSGYNPATAVYMHSQIPDSVLMPMEGCSHMAAGEQPEKWRNYIIKFINE